MRSVFVDPLQQWPGKKGLWCHMMSENLKELHRFAQKIGLKRAWFQSKDIPHYDLTERKRILALQNGAQEVSRKKIVSLINHWRKKEKGNGNGK